MRRRPSERWRLVQADLVRARRGARGCGARRSPGGRGSTSSSLNAAMMLETPLDGDDEAWDDAWEQTLRVNVSGPASSRARRSATSPARRRHARSRSRAGPAHRGSAIPQLSAYAASKAAVQRDHADGRPESRARGRSRVRRRAGIVRTRDVGAGHRTAAASTRSTRCCRWGRSSPPEEVGGARRLPRERRAGTSTGATLDVNGASYVR